MKAKVSQLCLTLFSFPQKNIYFCFIDYAKAFACVDHNKLENSSRDGNTRPLDLPLFFFIFCNFYLFIYLRIFCILRFFFFYLWWILSYIEMKQPWVYMCSPSRFPLPPPTPPAPPRFSQCTRSERLSHASNLGWGSVSPR